MTNLGEIISNKRKKKRISLERAERDLHIKREHLEALEASLWQNLPEPPFVQGFLKTYANYLGLDARHILALYRREFDQSQYPKKPQVFEGPKKLLITARKLKNLAIILAILVTVAYLTLQYLSILSSPKLEILAPPDDQTVSIPAIEISGKTEREAVVSINGEFIKVDNDGNFNYQLEIVKGRNVIEIIASKRLSPKTKVTKVVRLIE